MNRLRGVIVSHGALAAALIGAVEQIAGTDSGLVAISNADYDRVALEEQILAAALPGPSIVFVDLPSGSCHIAAMRHLQPPADVAVVTGVNLAMLLEFVFHRDGEVHDVARLVAEAGARAVVAR